MMDIDKLTIKQVMEIKTIINVYGKDENKLNNKLLEYVCEGTETQLKDGNMLLIKLMSKLDVDLKQSLIQRFEYNGKEWGFIPNLDEITIAEYIDLDNYFRDGEQLHRIASILYRPIVKKMGKTYMIEKYEGTDKYSSELEGLEYSVISSAMVFFCNLEMELLRALDTYTAKLIQTKEKMTTK